MLSQYHTRFLASFLYLIDRSIGAAVTTTTTTATATTPCAEQYSQCAGAGWIGPPACCDEPYECIVYLDLVPTPVYTCGIYVPPPTSPPTPPPVWCAPEYGQCGGRGFTGPHCCQPGLTCFVNNDYFHNCYTADPGAATAVPGT